MFMARLLLQLCSVLFASVLWAIATSAEAIQEDGRDGAACSSWDAERQEQEETFAATVEMLQVNKQSMISTENKHDIAPKARSEAKEEKSEMTDEAAVGLVQKDHNGNMCMLCGKPLPERVNKTYNELRKDCGGMSSPTGPPENVLKTPVAQFMKLKENGVESNGFCELNFAKSCADAVANKDYLYWAKSLDLNAPEARQNAAWDGRYCRLNGFLEASMVSLQHDFHATQAKAKELCKTKYAKYNIENITFMDMMAAARYDDETAPTLDEAERLAAWNCAMGDLGCDMSLCAYSFCEKGQGTGLYDECHGWHPVNGMPAADKF